MENWREWEWSHRQTLKLEGKLLLVKRQFNMQTLLSSAWVNTSWKKLSCRHHDHRFLILSYHRLKFDYDSIAMKMKIIFVKVIKHNFYACFIVKIINENSSWKISPLERQF
jgi:hypothetical protein